MGIAGSAIEWIEGAYPPGNFNALHVWTLANFAYLLALIHYLDKSAASAIASFRLIIAPAASDGQPTEEGKSTYARLAFQLTTLPSRPALLAAIIGMGFAIVVSALQFSAGSVPSYLVGTAGTALSNASMLVMLTVAERGFGIVGLPHNSSACLDQPDLHALPRKSTSITFSLCTPFPSLVHSPPSVSSCTSTFG